MIRICRVNNLRTLTYGNSYVIMYELKGFYMVRNDRGVVRRYRGDNFFDEISARSFNIDVILE